GHAEARARVVSGAPDPEVDLTLTRPGAIRGRVLGPGGQGVLGNARVDATPEAETVPEIPDPRAEPSDPAVGRRAHALSARDDGSFRLWPLRPGRWDVAVRGVGYQADIRRGVEVREGEDTVVDLTLERGGAIEGRLVDASGAPLEGLRGMIFYH